MARSKTIIEPNGHKCVFCGEEVHYWANCCRSTCKDYGNAGYVITKRKSRLWFHNTCFRENAGKKSGEKNG